MIASTQITNTEVFAFIAVLVFKLLSRKGFFVKQKRQIKLLKSIVYSFMFDGIPLFT